MANVLIISENDNDINSNDNEMKTLVIIKLMTNV